MVAAMTVDREQVVAYRLTKQGLTERFPRRQWRSAGKLALQNTPPGSAMLGIRARAPEVSITDLRHALRDRRTLLEAWSLRSSPCVFRTEDLPLFTSALQPDDETSLRGVMQGFLPVLDDMGRSATDTIELVSQALQDAFAGGTELTKRQMATALQQRLPGDFHTWCEPDTFNSFTGILARAVALSGLFVLTPRDGAEATFMQTDHWLEATPPRATQRTARNKLVRRYLHLHGPSTSTDFAQWAGITSTFAQQIWHQAAPSLAEVNYEGTTAYIPRGDAATLESPPQPHGFRLLPPYDPYLQQPDRRTLVPDQRDHRSIWKKVGNPGVVLRHGEIVATWRNRKQGSKLAVTITPLRFLSRADRDAITTEAEALGPIKECRHTTVTTEE